MNCNISVSYIIILFCGCDLISLEGSREFGRFNQQSYVEKKNVYIDGFSQSNSCLGAEIYYVTAIYQN